MIAAFVIAAVYVLATTVLLWACCRAAGRADRATEAATEVTDADLEWLASQAGGRS